MARWEFALDTEYIVYEAFPATKKGSRAGPEAGSSTDDLAFARGGFVLPGVFFLKLQPDGGGLYTRTVAVLCITLGVVGAVFGTSAAILASGADRFIQRL